ncbi:MAG: SAM-dependent methyltransferase [Actinomycetota bacterium]
MHRMLFYPVGERLSASELSAARLDGVLFEVGEGYMPADTVEGASARATSLGVFVGPGVALCGPSAAWVHGAGDSPPARHHVQRSVTRRLRLSLPARVRFHEPAVAPNEVLSIAGVAVVEPVRTLVDLALGAHRHVDYALWTRHLVVRSPDLVAPALSALEQRQRTPGKREGITLLTTTYEDVTR